MHPFLSLFLSFCLFFFPLSLAFLCQLYLFSFFSCFPFTQFVSPPFSCMTIFSSTLVSMQHLLIHSSLPILCLILFFFYPVITSDSVQINVRYIFASSVLIGFPLWKTLLLLSSLFSLIFYLFLFLLYLLLFCPPKLAILLIFIFLLCRFVLNIALSCVYMKLKIKKYIFPNRSKRSSGCSVVFASVMLL